MRYKRSKRTPRSKLIQAISALFRKILLIERGENCELCLKRKGDGLFHILPVGTYPRLRFHSRNVLISCWMPCHFSFHHDYLKAREIVKRIKFLRGADYETDLKILNRVQSPLSLSRLNDLKTAFTYQLKGLETPCPKRKYRKST